MINRIIQTIVENKDFLEKSLEKSGVPTKSLCNE